MLTYKFRCDSASFNSYQQHETSVINTCVHLRDTIFGNTSTEKCAQHTFVKLSWDTKTYRKKHNIGHKADQKYYHSELFMHLLCMVHVSLYF